MTRRTLLQLGAAGGLAALAGCRPDAGAGAASAMPTTSARRTGSFGSAASATALARRVADAERSLIAAYDNAIAGHGELAALLAPLRSDHIAHLGGLTPGATPPPSSAVPAASTPASKPASTPASNPATPAVAAEVTTQLADLERAAAAQRVDDLMAASDGAGSLARLLASIGGCEASHADLLRIAAAEAHP